MALMAGLALATGVESANIVGYQDFNGSAFFNLTANTFQPVGDGAAFTLADITVNSTFDNGSDYITIFSGGSSLFKVSYLNAADAADEGVAEGWYLTSDFDDWSFTHCKNSESLAGKGIVFNRGKAGSCIRYKGEVKDETYTITGSAFFNIVGNATPVTITLGDITVNSTFDNGSDYITVFEGGTSQYKASYLNAADAADEGVVAGWYLTSDFDDWSFTHCKNSESFPAGKGFVFNRGKAGSALILPNPLAQSND